MNLFRFIGISVLLLSSCNWQANIQTIVLSQEDALRAINNERLDSYTHYELGEEMDTLFSLVSVNPEVINEPFYFLARRKVDFYVFQNRELIYKNLANEFYQGTVNTDESYFHFKDEKKQIHSLTLRNSEPLYVLMKHHSKRDTEDLISFEKPSLNPIEILKDNNLPLIEINTLRCALTDEKYNHTELGFSSDTLGFNVNAKIKIRGASSKSFPKKQFSIKSDKSFLFEGIQLKKAVLYAPYVDRSLLRNKLAYDLFSEMSGRSNPSHYCNVLVNGNYEGVYLLLEHPKQQFKSQQIIDENSSSFLVQIDRCPCDIIHTSVEEGYINPGYIIELPSKPEEKRQQEIEKKMYDFELAIQRGDFSDIDIDRFIDFIIINELSKNIDAYRLSTFLAFDGNKMSIGPIWDFNIAWGLAEHVRGFEPNGFVIDGETKMAAPYWWQSLWENDFFQQRLKTKYAMYRTSILSNETISLYVDSIAVDLDRNLKFNDEKWALFGRNIWPNKYESESHEEELELLKNWIDNRLLWVDEQWLD